jgi:outer membrane immunogenic protein
MKKNQFLTGVAALALLDASGARAAPVAPTFNWTGFYVGGHVGYGWGNVAGDTTVVSVPPGLGFANPPGTQIFAFDRNLKPNGGLGGGQFGYNYQIGSAVLGFEADFSWTGQRGSSNFNGARFVISEDYVYQETLRAQLEYMGTARARLGYAFGMFMPYMTGGFAWGHATGDFNSALTQLFGPTQTITTSQSRMLTGGTIGVGFEYAFAPKWSVKAEYLYVDLGKKIFFDGQSGGAFGFQDHVLRVGFNFRP